MLENYNKYYRLAYSYVHHEADAADIVQNGAYKAIKNSDALKQEEYAQTWIYRIMLNEIFGYVKNNREVSLDEMPAEEGREDRYENIDLRRALDAMEERDKAVIELRYFEDMKLEDLIEVADQEMYKVKKAKKERLKNQQP